MLQHIMFKTGDIGAPQSILDRNGEVVLAMCKVCGLAENELGPACPGVPLARSFIPHADDTAVDIFAAWMKVKLREKRRQGYSGWNDKAAVTSRFLSNELRNSVLKGDPIDVANFCMFLHQRGERIL